MCVNKYAFLGFFDRLADSPIDHILLEQYQQTQAAQSPNLSPLIENG